MALRDPSPKLTYEDYVLLPEDGKRHEIIDGEHYVTAAPFVPHQDLLVRLTVRLGAWVEDHQLGRFLIAPTDVILSPCDIVQPDLLFISRERASIVTQKNVQGPPDLVGEILSDSTRRLDQEVKRKIYARFGVREYWLIDRSSRTIQVWEHAEGSFRLRANLSTAARDILSTPLMPGLEIRLAEIFRD